MVFRRWVGGSSEVEGRGVREGGCERWFGDGDGVLLRIRMMMKRGFQGVERALAWDFPMQGTSGYPMMRQVTGFGTSSSRKLGLVDIKKKWFSFSAGSWT